MQKIQINKNILAKIKNQFRAFQNLQKLSEENPINDKIFNLIDEQTKNKFRLIQNQDSIYNNIKNFQIYYPVIEK